MKYYYVIHTEDRLIDATSRSHAEYLYDVYSRNCKETVELLRIDEYGATRTLKTNIK